MLTKSATRSRHAHSLTSVLLVRKTEGVWHQGHTLSSSLPPCTNSGPASIGHSAMPSTCMSCVSHCEPLIDFSILASLKTDSKRVDSIDRALACDIVHVATPSTCVAHMAVFTVLALVAVTGDENLGEKLGSRHLRHLRSPCIKCGALARCSRMWWRAAVPPQARQRRSRPAQYPYPPRCDDRFLESPCHSCSRRLQGSDCRGQVNSPPV